jgi:ATP-dependent helicase HrpB
MHDTFPIDPYIPELRQALRASSFVILKAEPGAGKTTRVPQALLADFKRILVVQPRRLAARLAAEWVAQQSGQDLGRLVGYQVRLESKAGPETRLLFVTEGILTRRLLSDRQLRDFDLVILDEFHERHIHTDLALAMLRQLTEERTDLKALVMSATLDQDSLAEYLDGSRVFQVPGRTFPVAIDYRPGGSQQGLEDQVATAVQAMVQDARCGGNILVFLSGLSEIQSCAHRLTGAGDPGFDVIPLTAELASNYSLLQQRPERCKVVLSTNVAETSVTLPNIRGVIDSGWAKISGFAPWSGLSTLERQRISQASCIQRTGRAGRVAPGVCYRLFSSSDFSGRLRYTQPEILRIDLCQTLLELQAIYTERARAWEHLPWFEAPDPTILQDNLQLLHRLGALTPEGQLSERGRKMAELPLHPRLGRVVLAAQEQGLGEAGLLGALLIHEGMLLRRDDKPRDYGLCDVSYQAQLFLQALRREDLRSPIDRGKVQRIRVVYDNLRRTLGIGPLSQLQQIDEAGLRKAIFAGFADRVAKFRPLPASTAKRQRHYNFCLGRGGILSDGSVVREAEWLVAIEAMEILDDESGTRGRISIASAVDALWLESDPFQLLQDTLEVRLEEKTGRARKIQSRLYGKLVLREVQEQADAAELSELIFQVVKERWPAPFSDLAPLAAYHKKLALLGRHGIEHQMPVFEGDMLELLQFHLCEGTRSLAELAQRSIGQAIAEQLDYQDLRQLETLCPETISLSNGKRFKVHYEDEGEPWIEGRIQEFFGQADTPRIVGGRQALLIKLLAPSRRPAQITQDLRGFWLGSYQEVKKELKRRYPKHAWPEDPLTYQPEPPASKGR